jgi:hypothetical protein
MLGELRFGKMIIKNMLRKMLFALILVSIGVSATLFFTSASSPNNQDQPILDSVQQALLLWANGGDNCYTAPDGGMQALPDPSISTSILSSASQLKSILQPTIGPSTSPWYIAYNSEPNYKQNVVLLSKTYADQCRDLYDALINKYMSGEIRAQVLQAENYTMPGWANPQQGNYDGPAGPLTETLSSIGNIVVDGTKAVVEAIYTSTSLNALAKIPQGPISANPVPFQWPTTIVKSTEIVTATLKQNSNGQWQVILLQVQNPNWP